MDPVEERLRGLLQGLTPAAPGALDPTSVQDAARRRARRHRIAPVAVTAVAVLAIVVVVLGVLVDRPGDHAAPPAGRVAPSTPAVTAPTAATHAAPGSSSPVTVAVGPTGGPVPGGFTPSSATFVSSSTGWVLGTAPCAGPPCTSMVRTRDGGTSWVGIPAPRTSLAAGGADGSGVSAVRFADDANGWAFGPDLWSTHDGGATWRPVDPPGGGRVERLETDGGQAVAVVLVGSAPAAVQVFGSRVGSDAWTPLGTAGTGTADLAVTGTDWFVAGEGGVLHGTGLRAGAALPAPCAASFTPDQVASPRPADVDVLCVGGAAMGSRQVQLVGSTDGGRTWSSSAPPSVRQAPDAIADSGTGVLLIAAASGDSTIARSSDFGVSVDQVLTGAASGGVPWSDLGFTTATQALAVLRGAAMYLSRDAGVHWSTVSFG